MYAESEHLFKAVKRNRGRLGQKARPPLTMRPGQIERYCWDGWPKVVPGSNLDPILFCYMRDLDSPLYLGLYS